MQQYSGDANVNYSRIIARKYAHLIAEDLAPEMDGSNGDQTERIGQLITQELDIILGNRTQAEVLQEQHKWPHEIRQELHNERYYDQIKWHSEPECYLAAVEYGEGENYAIECVPHNAVIIDADKPQNYSDNN